MRVRSFFHCGALVLLVVFGTLAAILPAQAAPTYAVRQITNESLPLGYLGLNNQGQLVWQTGSSTAPSYYVYLYSGGLSRMLSNPDTPAHFPKLNNQGQVTWQNNNNPIENNQICLFSDNQVFTLASGVQYHNPYQPQINNRGQVLWWTDTNQMLRTQIFLYTHETKTTVPITDGTNCDLFQVLNDNGAIAWERVIGIVGPDHAIMLNGGNISGQGSYTNPILINNQGKVLYTGFGANEGNLYLYDAGQVYLIASNPNHPPMSVNLNNRGQVVYSSYDASNKQQIFLYDQGQTIIISQSLDPGAGSPVNSSPVINNRGQVVWVHSDGMSSPQLFLYDSGKITQITSGYWFFTFGPGPLLNDQGQIAWIGVNKPSGMSGQVFLATPRLAVSIYSLLLD